jgi:hypothetical protein
VTVAIDPALAALAGSAIGGLTTLAVTWITQNTLANAAIGARERTVRYDLYRQFIEEATKLYGDAIVSDKVEVSMLVGAYALISRMRVLSSSDIVDRADAALRAIVNIYFSSNKTMAELRAEINGGKLDLLRDFSSAAREELSTLKY